MTAINPLFQRATFCKEERLTSRKLIADIMQKGTSFQEYPFKFIYLPAPATNIYPIQVCIAVSKRKINKATGRNLVKRRIREVWRTNKHFIYDYLHTRGTHLALMVIYTGKETEPTTAALNAKMQKALSKFIQIYESYQPPA